MKRIITLTGFKTTALSLMMALGLFFSSAVHAADVTYATTTGDWTDANWSPQAPVNGDNIIIPSGAIVTVSTDVSLGNTVKFNKVTVNGKLVVNSTGSLNIEQTVSNSPILNVVGGEVVNTGSLIIKQTLANATTVCLQLSDNASTDSKFSSTGNLTIDNTLSTNASTSGRCISFYQTTAGRTAQLTLGGSLTLNVKTSTRFIELQGGQAQIDGVFTIGSASDYKNWRFMHLAPVTGTVTIASTANITMFTGFDSTNGCININSGAAGNVSLINNGILTLNGGGTFTTNTPYGISVNPQATSTTSSYGTLTNTGTINIAGNFPGGCLFMTGANYSTSYPKVDNTGTINLTNTYTGTGNGSAFRTTVNSAMQTVVLNNTGGTMLLSAANTNSIYFGLYGTINNTGSFSVNKPIIGSSTSVTPTINNNAGGVFDFNIAVTDTTLSKKYKLAFVNGGGKVTGKGIFGSGTFSPSTGTLSPGGDAGVGTFTFADLTLTGKCYMNVNGKTNAGTDYDQIISTGTLTIDPTATLEMVVGGSYIPTNQDVVHLFSGTTAVSGTFASITAPSKWVTNYTTNNANALFDSSTGIAKASTSTIKVYANGHNVYVSQLTNSAVQLQIVDMAGRIMTQANLKGQNNIVNTSGLKGLFLVRLITSDEVYSQKIIL